MKKSIEHPKVFISYAWADKEYENMVLSFAEQLVKVGIDVVLDKWDLSEGNDTFAFMEKCVNDPSITNVLMLIDPVYAEKANKRAGGVGTETQIISEQVYNKVEQDKFIPIIMKRDEEGRICKPTYLTGRLHFDFTNPDTYDNEYKRLVKTLFGVEAYKKPELGDKPKWVDDSAHITLREEVKYNTIKKEKNEKIRIINFIKYLEDIRHQISQYIDDNKMHSRKLEGYLNLYDSFEFIRNNFLQLINNSVYIEDSYKYIADFFEDMICSIKFIDGYAAEVVRIRLHEMFIYTVAYYIKNNDYLSTSRFLGRTYFDNTVLDVQKSVTGYGILYSGIYQSNLDNAVNKHHNKVFIAGTGKHWQDTLNIDFCSLNDFIKADLICYNYSIYGKNYIGTHYWFPIMYIYDDYYNGPINKMAKLLISRERCLEIIQMFGYEDIDNFLEKFKKIENILPTYSAIRYNGAFNSAPLIGYYIKSDQIASVQ